MSDLRVVFGELRKILEPYALYSQVLRDDSEELYLNSHFVQKNKKALFFGAVQLKKRYVSFHLMPVYLKPELLATISPALKRSMQGKSCFNFTDSDPVLFKELDALTQISYENYQLQGYM